MSNIASGSDIERMILNVYAMKGVRFRDFVRVIVDGL